MLKIGDGSIMAQKLIANDKNDYFRAMKFYHSTLYIVGDTSSVIKWYLDGSEPADYNRTAAFILKVNCDLQEISCLKANNYDTKKPVYTNTGLW